MKETSRLAAAVLIVASGMLCCGGTDDSTTPSTSTNPSPGSLPEFVPPKCGDGSVDDGEDCDDGNLKNGDLCPSTCVYSCGDGQIRDDEQCDDGNAVDGDGCSNCKRPGSLAWTNNTDCQGRSHISPDGLISVVCSSPMNALMQRYSPNGKLTSSVRNVVADANEGVIYAIDVVERDGALYVAMEVQRSANANTEAHQPRTRIAKYDATSLALVWQREITTFPNGKFESPTGIAVNSAGQVAVVGTSFRDLFASDGMYVALLSASGEISWKQELSSEVTISDGSNGHALDGGVAIDDAGNVVIATLTDKDQLATTYTATRVVSFDASGTVQWERPFTTQPGTTGGAVAQALTLTAVGDIELLYVQYVEDPLVPNPPRTTASVRQATLAGLTGTLGADNLIASTSTDKITWRALSADAPLVPAREAKYMASQWNSGTSITGLTEDGQIPWTITLDANEKWLRGLIAYKHVVCASYTKTELLPTMYCYFTS